MGNDSPPILLWKESSRRTSRRFRVLVGPGTDPDQPEASIPPVRRLANSVQATVQATP